MYYSFYGENSLESKYSIPKLLTMFVHSIESKTGTRSFDASENYLIFFEKYLKEKNKEGYYEVILGEKEQKPHFDIDIDLTEFENVPSEIEILTDFIDAVQTILIERNINYSVQNYFITTSHREGKMSFHIILDKLYHANHRESKLFYDKVINKLVEKNSFLVSKKNIVDSKVYSSLQNFRILWSSKKNKPNFKKQIDQITYKGILYKFDSITTPLYNRSCIESIKKSLITTIQPEDILLIENEIKLNKEIKIKYADFEVSDQLTSIEQFFKIFEAKNKIEDCFDISEVKNNIIVLMRKKSCLCPICERVHDNQNAYLFIIGNKIYFGCYRSNEKKIKIGEINGEINDPDSVSKIEPDEIRGIEDVKDDKKRVLFNDLKEEISKDNVVQIKHVDCSINPFFERLTRYIH
jgi:hypothetical protein